MSSYTSEAELLSTHQTLHATFKTGKTKSLAWRKWQLKQCWWMIHENFETMAEALKKDLNRDSFEAQSAELYSIKNTLLATIEKLEEWTKSVRPKGNGFIFGKDC
jgi:aldehyde dehydrogenase (NAD+)